MCFLNFLSWPIQLVRNTEVSASVSVIGGFVVVSSDLMIRLPDKQEGYLCIIGLQVPVQCLFVFTKFHPKHSLRHENCKGLLNFF